MADDLCRALDQYVDPPAPRIDANRRWSKEYKCAWYQETVPGAGAADETLKAAFLQNLYQQSGRTCGTFSGLWAEFRQQCLQEHLDALAEQLAQEKRRVWGEQRKGGES